jgi:hypothetical protein
MMVPPVQQVMRQTKARIYRGDTRSAGKIVSIFEAISRGDPQGQVAADAGFYSSQNQAAAKAKGVKRVCIPDHGTKSASRKLRISEETPAPQFTATTAAEPAQNRPSYAPPSVRGSRPFLSTRRSPNAPSDHCMAVPVLRLPGSSESDRCPVGQGKIALPFQPRHYIWACPSVRLGGCSPHTVIRPS